MGAGDEAGAVAGDISPYARHPLLHGCYSLGDDQLYGVNRRHKGGDHSLAANKSIRAARADDAPIYVIMDNLPANKTPAVRAWAARHNVELCLTPTYASWATRSRPSSDHYARSPWAHRTTRTTRPWRAGCRPTCAGATPTFATPTSSPRNAENAPGSAANATNAGADHEQHDPVNVDVSALAVGVSPMQAGARGWVGGRARTGCKAGGCR